VDLDKSPVTSGVMGALKSIKAFKVKTGDEQKLKDDLNDGKLNAILVLDKGIYDSVKSGEPARSHPGGQVQPDRGGHHLQRGKPGAG